MGCNQRGRVVSGRVDVVPTSCNSDLITNDGFCKNNDPTLKGNPEVPSTLKTNDLNLRGDTDLSTDVQLQIERCNGLDQEITSGIFKDITKLFQTQILRSHIFSNPLFSFSSLLTIILILKAHTLKNKKT